MEEFFKSFFKNFQGEALYCFVTMNDGSTFDTKVESELRTMIREKIAPFATPDFIQSAPELPKTRSRKIMRRVLKKIANNEKDLGDISTMADSSVVEVQGFQRYISVVSMNYLSSSGIVQEERGNDGEQREEVTEI